MASAALVAFWAIRQAGSPPQFTYVVAAVDLAPGHEIEAGDIAPMSGPLNADLAGRTFRDPADLAGGIVTRPLGAGQLIDRSDVAAGDGIDPRPGWELSLGLEADRVAAETGDVVDVVAAVGSGETATSEAVANAVRVQSVTWPESFEGSSVVVVLGLDSLDQVLAVSRAATAGEVFLVRTNEVARS